MAVFRPGPPPQASDLELYSVIGAVMLHDRQEVTTQGEYDRADERLALLRVQIVVEIPGTARAEIAAD